MTSYVWTFCSSWTGSHTCKVSPRSVQPLQRRFLKKKKIWLWNHVTDDVWIFFLLTILTRDNSQKFPYWSDVAFYICNYDIITRAPMMSLKKKSLIPHEEYLLCAKFQFFPWCGFRDTEVQSLSIFPIWLPHHVTDDIIIIYSSQCQLISLSWLLIKNIVHE